MNNTCYLFAYGTLQYPSVQQEVVGKVLEKKMVGHIHEWKLNQIRIEDLFYLAAERTGNQKNKICGCVFEINESDLSNLDTFETDAYQRHQIGEFEEKPLWIYIDNTKKEVSSTQLP